MSYLLKLSYDARRLLMIFINYTKENAHVETMSFESLNECFQNETSYPAALCSGLYRRSLAELVNGNILARDCFGDDNNPEPDLFFGLTEEFVDEARELYFPKSPPLQELLATIEKEDIPAADRFVSVSDNQIDTSQAISALDELANAIRSANDLTLNAEYRLQISKEINFLKEIIEQPKIHVVALWDGIKNNHTLEWLAEKVGSELVREVAAKALVVLTNLLTNLINHL